MKIVLDKGAYMPVRGHATDAGLDIRTPEAFTLKAHGQQELKILFIILTIANGLMR